MSDSNPYLVTGGAGFIGSYLTMELLERDHHARVVVADCNPDRRRLVGFKERFDKVKDRVTFVNCDVSELAQVLSVFDTQKPRSVFHLGALLSAGADANPTHGFDVDLLGTRHVFEAARLYGQHKRTGPIRVLFPSTIASFGRFLPAGLVANESVQMPTTVYGVSKVACERLGEWYQARMPEAWIDFRGVRFPSVIGASRGPGGTTVYSTLMVQEPLRGRPYEVYVAEDTRLDILYVKDAVRALLELHDADNSALKRRVYNIAGIRIDGQAPTAGDIKNAVTARGQGVPAISFKVNQQLQDTVRTFGVLDATAAGADWKWKLEWSDLNGAITDFGDDIKKYPDRIKSLELY